MCRVQCVKSLDQVRHGALSKRDELEKETGGRVKACSTVGWHRKWGPASKNRGVGRANEIEKSERKERKTKKRNDDETNKNTLTWSILLKTHWSRFSFKHKTTSTERWIGWWTGTEWWIEWWRTITIAVKNTMEEEWTRNGGGTRMEESKPEMRMGQKDKSIWHNNTISRNRKNWQTTHLYRVRHFPHWWKYRSRKMEGMGEKERWIFNGTRQKSTSLTKLAGLVGCPSIWIPQQVFPHKDVFAMPKFGMFEKKVS